MEKRLTNAAEYNPAAFFRLINHPFKARIFLLTKIPAAYFSGLRIEYCHQKACAVSVPFTWFTQNPFRCTYFACLAMAAELSTGALVLSQIYKRKPGVSMLITGMEAKYYKKAVSKTIFSCMEGEVINEMVNNTLHQSTPQTITVKSVGQTEQGEAIADFWFTWSFKTK